MTTWAEVEADHHQFYLSPADQNPMALGKATDVFEAGRRHLLVRTGVSTGPVTVGLSILDSPPANEFDEWENVAQTMLAVAKDLLIITTNGDVVDDFAPVLAPPGGVFAARVSTSGRGLQWDAIVDEPSERFLIELWPTTATVETEQLKSTDGTWDSTFVEYIPEPHPGQGEADWEGGSDSRTEDASARLYGPSESAGGD